MYLQNEGVLRHETLQLFLFLFPLRHMKRPALQNKQAGVLRMAFRARKDFGAFEKRAPELRRLSMVIPPSSTHLMQLFVFRFTIPKSKLILWP